MRGYLRDVLSDGSFWAGIGLICWVLGLVALGAGR